MMPFNKPLYITCEKCNHQSDIPQTGDLLLGGWERCPKCGSKEWELKEKMLLQKVIDVLFRKF